MSATTETNTISEIGFYAFDGKFIVTGKYGLRMGEIVGVVSGARKEYKFLPFPGMAFTGEQLFRISEFIQSL